MRVSVHIVTHQSMPDIADALLSLTQQTFDDFRVVIVDNASTDETFTMIEREYGNRLAILRNYQNLGFAAAHNQAIRLFATRLGAKKPEFVLVMNPDIQLEPTTLEELVRAMERHPRAGVVGPRLLRADHATIDTTGIRVRKSFHFFERGSGKPETGNYLREEEVFGTSGALALYRTEALEDVKGSSGYFDEDFFAYREDIDLSWRLRLRGWQAWYVPNAVALHQRRVGAPERRTWRDVLRARSVRSPLVSRWSYRNHWWTLIKNLHGALLVRYSPWFLTREVGKFFYLLILEPHTLGVCAETLRGIPRMLRRRKTTFERATCQATDMRKWFQ